MAVSSGNGMFRNGASTGISHTAFDPSLERVNSYNQGSSAGGYTVRAGETLGSIAANLWGDSSLWYKLAQANGLSGEAALSEGQSLRIPAGVMKSTHNASTFKPYDPAETLGDTAPTAAKPPKKNKCGAFGQVLLVVIAVAVATVVSGGLAGLAGSGSFWGGASALANGGSLLSIAGGNIGVAIAAGAAGGAAGSIASQAVGVATNIQDKFSWTGVATAAFSGALGGGGFLKNSNAFIQGAGTNALSQAASIALGPQSKFSWASVAAAGAGSWAGNKFATSKFGQALAGHSAFASQIGAGTASAIVNAATRTAFGEGQFGDNIRAAIPDVIGQAIGGAIAGGLSQRRLDRMMAEEALMSAETAIRQHHNADSAADVLSLTADAIPNFDSRSRAIASDLRTLRGAVSSGRYQGSVIEDSISIIADNSSDPVLVRTLAKQVYGELQATNTHGSNIEWNVPVRSLNGSIANGGRVNRTNVPQLYGPIVDDVALAAGNLVNKVAEFANHPAVNIGLTVLDIAIAAAKGPLIGPITYALGQVTGKVTEFVSERSVAFFAEEGIKKGIGVERSFLMATGLVAIGGLVLGATVSGGIKSAVQNVARMSRTVRKLARAYKTYAFDPRFNGLPHKIQVPDADGKMRTMMVFERKIDPHLVVDGKTNLELMRSGRPPYVDTPNGLMQLQGHHFEQDGRGPIVPLTRAEHGTRPWNENNHPYGNKKNPDYPKPDTLWNDQQRPSIWKYFAKRYE